MIKISASIFPINLKSHPNEKKLHANNLKNHELHDEILNIIFLYDRHILDRHSFLLVSKKWNKIADHDINQWQFIAKKLQSPSLENIPNTRILNCSYKKQVKITIQTIHSMAQKDFFSLFKALNFQASFLNEMKKLKKRNSYEDIVLTQEMIKARNLFNITKEFQNYSNPDCGFLDLDFKNYRSTNEVMDTLALFGIWSLNNSRLSSITYIKLKEKTLSMLPFEIFSFLPNLLSLSLNQNALISIPLEIRLSNNLRKLRIMENNLTTFPTGILSLTHLEELNLSLNAINYIPTKISQLTALQRFDISSNDLHSIPIAEFMNMKNLRFLDISENCNLPLRVHESFKLKIPNVVVVI